MKLLGEFITVRWFCGYSLRLVIKYNIRIYKLNVWKLTVTGFLIEFHKLYSICASQFAYLLFGVIYGHDSHILSLAGKFTVRCTWVTFAKNYIFGTCQGRIFVARNIHNECRG